MQVGISYRYLLFPLCKDIIHLLNFLSACILHTANTQALQRVTPTVVPVNAAPNVLRTPLERRLKTALGLPIQTLESFHEMNSKLEITDDGKYVDAVFREEIVCVSILFVVIQSLFKVQDTARTM